MSDEQKDPVDRLVSAYESMLERVHEAADNAEKKTLPWLRESLAGAREKAVERGNQFDTIPAAELIKWRRITDKLAASWVKEMDAKGYQGQAMLDTAKALIQKANTQ